MKKIFFPCIFIFFCSKVAAQISLPDGKLNGIFTFKDNFCSASYLFKPSGDFFYEGGCEERSNIAKGTYKIEGEKIILITTAAPIEYSIKSGNNKNSNKINVSIIDVDGKPLLYTKIMTLPYKMSGDTLENIGSLLTDSVGHLIIDASKINSISLDRYDPSNRFNHKENVYHWKLVSSLGSDNLTIQFNYPLFCLRYPEIAVTSIKNQLQITNNKAELIDNQNNIYKKTEQ